MAKRRGGGGGEILLLVLAAVVAAVAFAGPFVIAGWVIFTELRARRYGNAGSASEVLSSDERVLMGRCEDRLRTLELEASQLDAQGVAMGLYHRADGGFDERNVRARGMNVKLADLQRRYFEARAEHEALKRRLEAKMSDWLKARSSVVGARAGLVTFVVVFVLAVLSQSSEPASPNTFLGLEQGARLGVSLLATLAAGVAIWIGSSAARASLAA